MVNGCVARIHVRFAGVSRVFRADSRLFRESRAGCFASLAAVSRLFRTGSHCESVQQTRYP